MIAAPLLLDALAFEIYPDDKKPLYRQVYEGILQNIVKGNLPPRTRLPSTRELASVLGVSRNTLVQAYAQLVAEGYLQGTVGSGTYVEANLPANMAEIISPPKRGKATALVALPAKSRQFSQVPVWFKQAIPAVAFRTNLPALDLFPINAWAKITAQIYKKIARDPQRYLLAEGASQGYRPLRDAIAEHLLLTRGVNCTPDNIIIFSGAQQALDVTLRVLINPGDPALFEDPGFIGAKLALIAAGAQIIPMPVDEHGMDIRRSPLAAAEGQIAYVCPSKHFPLGTVMSLERRLHLLEWANLRGTWIIEDDYDHEFRFSGRPIPALQGLDHGGRVIYLGTFSKVLFPALRVGYAIVPDALVDTFVSAQAVVSRYPAMIEQMQVHEFMQAGHFTSHLQRMRKIYMERHGILCDYAQRYLADYLRIEKSETGMQALAWLREDFDDEKVAALGLNYGLELLPVSRMTLSRALPPGLLLGYGAFDRDKLHTGARALAQLLADYPHRP